MGLFSKLLAFSAAGAVAAIAHYGVLVALVETGAATPVPATLAGYIVGGVVSYVLNRRATYRSDRPHREATWRFAVVAFVGFLLTWFLMQQFESHTRVPYLLAQVLTTGVVLVWSFVAHLLWTFAPAARRAP
jgi:putative flippase GtrA